MKFIFRRKKKLKRLRDLSDAIIEIFEEKLDELNITLPDKAREGNEDEARIFGDTYYDLERDIEDLISINKFQIQKII